MNEAPQDLWFYTREGERAGPVGFAELRAKAAAAALDSRLDMVWRQGMEDCLVMLGAVSDPELQKALEGSLRAIREGTPKP